MRQAVNDAGTNKVPVVFHRQNREDWLVVVRLNDLPELVDRLSALEQNEWSRISPRRFPRSEGQIWFASPSCQRSSIPLSINICRNKYHGKKYICQKYIEQSVYCIFLDCEVGVKSSYHFDSVGMTVMMYLCPSFVYSISPASCSASMLLRAALRFVLKMSKWKRVKTTFFSLSIP